MFIVKKTDKLLLYPLPCKNKQKDDPHGCMDRLFIKEKGLYVLHLEAAAHRR